jgi:hypothetical protein
MSRKSFYLSYFLLTNCCLICKTQVRYHLLQKVLNILPLGSWNSVNISSMSAYHCKVIVYFPQYVRNIWEQGPSFSMIRSLWPSTALIHYRGLTYVKNDQSLFSIKQLIKWKYMTRKCINGITEITSLKWTCVLPAMCIQGMSVCMCIFSFASQLFSPLY